MDIAFSIVATFAVTSFLNFFLVLNKINAVKIEVVKLQTILECHIKEGDKWKKLIKQSVRQKDTAHLIRKKAAGVLHVKFVNIIEGNKKCINQLLKLGI